MKNSILALLVVFLLTMVLCGDVLLRKWHCHECKGQKWLEQSIDSVRLETKSGGNTKERIAGIMAELQCQQTKCK